jgi:thiol-disulfide isomerase/thioredoxin
MRLRQTLLAVGLCILLLSLATPAQKNKRSVARPANPIVVAPLNTDELKGLLTKEKTKPLLVNFWATWCDPCRDEFPDLVKIDSEYRPKSLDFVTVSLDEDTLIKTEVPRFLAEMKATMPAYLLTDKDPEPAINAVDPTWQGDLPATFLYNEKGEVVFKHKGRVDATQLRAAIEKLVKK